MSDKTNKTQADRKLIQDLFACDPLDWARYPDGTLTFINLIGQKHSYSQQFIEEFQADITTKKALANKAAAKKAAAKKSKNIETLPDPEPTSIILDPKKKK